LHNDFPTLSQHKTLKRVENLNVRKIHVWKTKQDVEMKKIPKQPEKKKSRENREKPPHSNVARFTGLLIEAWRKFLRVFT
jgi:hypothetical protein